MVAKPGGNKREPDMQKFEHNMSREHIVLSSADRFVGFKSLLLISLPFVPEAGYGV